MDSLKPPHKTAENQHKEMKPLIIVLLGPTCSGKTELGIELAEHFKLKIHNIDSRQLYKEMDIGTAKPSKSQQKRVEHFLIDLCPPNERINLHQFQKKANFLLEKNLKQKEIGLLVGGSGLYLKAITCGLKPPDVSPQKWLREQFQRLDQIECHQLLTKCDPISAKKISPYDSIRTIRALEVFYATGKPMSSQKHINPPPWRILELGLNPKDLEERISRRTNQMYKNGLIEETQALMNKYGDELPLLKTIGYQEVICIIKGSLTLTEAISITNQRTKNFAKRQRTWFKNQHSPKWLNDENPLKESISLIQEAIGC